MAQFIYSFYLHMQIYMKPFYLYILSPLQLLLFIFSIVMQNSILTLWWFIFRTLTIFIQLRESDVIIKL